MSGAQGNDRFMHVASPGYTSEQPGDGVWWPLRLNDMHRDCAVTIAMLVNQMTNALGHAEHCVYTRDQMRQWPPTTRQIINYQETFVRRPQAEVDDMFLESEMREAIYRSAYDYLRELVEAAYVC